MSLVSDIALWRTQGFGTHRRISQSPRDRARQHINRIFAVADEPTKKLLWQLDYLIRCTEDAKPGKAQELADQINAWCQSGEEVLIGRTLTAAVCEIFGVGGSGAA